MLPGFLAQHLSDIARVAVVWKAGGLYADFDFICMRKVSYLRNLLAEEVRNTNDTCLTYI